jgi:transcriptional regulator with XRE-family HTH domain
VAQALSEEAAAADIRIGSRLRQQREALEITQQELGSRTGLGQALISRLESGKHQPRFDTLVRYASGLGLSVQQLLETREGEGVLS